MPDFRGVLDTIEGIVDALNGTLKRIKPSKVVVEFGIEITNAANGSSRQDKSNELESPVSQSIIALAHPWELGIGGKRSPSLRTSWTGSGWTLMDAFR